ncbi:related to EF-hand superfamily Ca2+-modulated [Lecanosticta acicola]|uniref:Calmodulin n=1 Tax=Lecanosticta acicola TaxID=111012 RepID=A0AAI8YS43_9PEZI|nr:related to EF-hand superfamily Ca2+-modulated [Lecanosticta acicola]
MPPRRKQPAAAAAKPPAKRRSKLAKDSSITAEQEAEIQDAFALFSTPNEEFQDSKDGVIATNDVRRCLIALNLPPRDQKELRAFIEIADPEGTGWVPYSRFVFIAAAQMNNQDDGDEDARREEVAKAFRLFTRGEERLITLTDLRRIAKDLREDVPESVMKDMLREATGGGLGGVSTEEFEGVMRRAGVFG